MNTILRYLAILGGVLLLVAGLTVVGTSADRGGLPYGVGEAIIGGLLAYWGVSRVRREQNYTEE